ncbi:MAG: dihydrolipoyl dehydrogenase family protein [Thermoanaerobaculia bacterium]
MAHRLDLVVLGTGTAAAGVVSRCRDAGWSAAVVDERPFGGTCALRGCDPKKVLRRAAELVDATRLFHGKGIADPGLAVDWPALMDFKRSFTDPVPRAREKALADKGIATFKGSARFVDTNTIVVGEDRLEARYVVIASGAKPVPLTMPGAEHAITSDEFLELDELPGRILFIGGGYVSFEFAHIAARAGARIVMLDRGERPLEAFDADLVAMLVERTRELGVTFHARAEVSSIEKTDTGTRVTAGVEGTEERFVTDLVVHGAGRMAAIEALELDKANVKADRRGVEVNEYLQSTSNPAVYAAGDAAATAGPPLTPVAGLEAKVVAANLLDGNHVTPDYTGIPSAVFTIPELARVGLSEAEAKAQGLEFSPKFSDMRRWYTVRRVGETHAAAKVLVEEGTRRLLGAHVLGPEASELINLFGLAMRSGLHADDLRNLVSAYPSAGSDIGHLI